MFEIEYQHLIINVISKQIIQKHYLNLKEIWLKMWLKCYLNIQYIINVKDISIRGFSNKSLTACKFSFSIAKLNNVLLKINCKILWINI